MNSTHDTVTMLRLSTAHLTKKEARSNNEDWPLTCASWLWGYFVYVGDWRESGLEDQQDEWPGLAACAEYACAAGFSWVAFDQDNEAIDGLPTYVW